METILQKFLSWLHDSFVPHSAPDNWQRRDGSEILHANELPNEFLRENPAFRDVFGKMGLLGFLLILCFSVFSEGVNATTPATRPTGMAIDSSKDTTLIQPLAFRLIRKISQQ